MWCVNTCGVLIHVVHQCKQACYIKILTSPSFINDHIPGNKIVSVLISDDLAMFTVKCLLHNNNSAF